MNTGASAAGRSLAFALAGVVLVSGCRSDSSKPPGPVLKLGVAVPLSGDLAAYGRNAADGVLLAVEEHNSDPAMAARLRVEAPVEDTTGDPQRAVSALQKLLTVNGVTAVVGEIGSSATLAMAPVANTRQVVLLSPAASAPAVSEAGPFVFRTWPSDTFEAALMGRYLGEKGFKRVAVLYVNNDYGQAMLKAIGSLLAASGGSVVAAEAFMPGSTDMRTQVTKAAAAKPDVVYFVAYPAEAVVFLRQKRELRLRSPVVATSSFEDPIVLKQQAASAEGVVFTSPLPPPAADPTVSGFRSRYASRFKKEPGLVADTAYDAVRLIIHAALGANAVDGPSLQRGLSTITGFPGASGSLTFDVNGDVQKPAILKTVTHGRYQALDR